MVQVRQLPARKADWLLQQEDRDQQRDAVVNDVGGDGDLDRLGLVIKPALHDANARVDDQEAIVIMSQAKE